MCRERAGPEQSRDQSCLDLKGKTLSEWKEIRSALYCVEELRNNGNQHARVDVIERSKESSLRITFRTPAELDGYLKSRFRRVLLEGVDDSISLDDMEKASDATLARLESVEDVQGQVLLTI